MTPPDRFVRYVKFVGFPQPMELWRAVEPDLALFRAACVADLFALESACALVFGALGVAASRGRVLYESGQPFAWATLEVDGKPIHRQRWERHEARLQLVQEWIGGGS